MNATEGNVAVADPPSPTGVEAPAHIVVSNDQDDVPLDADRWATLAAAALADRGCGGELTLTFVDEVTIAELNMEHMGVNGPTDVLSFPLDDPSCADAPGAPPSLLGDVVICPVVAERQFADHAGSFDDEVALLVVHGVLHVLGHDHAEPTEAQDMRDLEVLLLERHHWNGPVPVGFSAEHRS
jgi:probable rRNA maturation factor